MGESQKVAGVEFEPGMSFSLTIHTVLPFARSMYGAHRISMANTTAIRGLYIA